MESGQRIVMLRPPRVTRGDRRRLFGWDQREGEHAVHLRVGEALGGVAIDEQRDPSVSARPVPPLARVSVPSTRTPAATTTRARESPLVASAERESKLASTSTAAPATWPQRAG